MVCAEPNRLDIMAPQPDAHAGLHAEAVSRLRASLVEMQRRNEELESFVRALAHDSGSLTRGIALRTELLSERLSGAEPEIITLVDSIADRAARLARMSEGLMRMARIGECELECHEIDLSGLTKEVGDELQRNTPSRQVGITVQSGLTCWGDPVLVRLVIENLLSNAWKYTANTATGMIEFGCRSKETEAVFYIADNGIGFSSDNTNALFSPFVRLSSAQGFAGTGLGLAIVKQIIERHGGWIRAEGACGQGAAFVFCLGTPSRHAGSGLHGTA